MRATARVDEFLRDDCARVVSDGNQRVAVDQPSQKSMECAPAFRRGYIPGPLARPSPPRAHLIKSGNETTQKADWGRNTQGQAARRCNFF